VADEKTGRRKRNTDTQELKAAIKEEDYV